MTMTIRHPDGWVGVPDYWPYPLEHGGTLDSPEEWATALADQLAVIEILEPSARARLIEVLLAAARISATTGPRIYLGFVEGWSGPARVLNATVRPRTEFGAMTIEQVAGVDDPAQLGPPFVEDVTTEEGRRGVRCFRYLPVGGDGAICGRLDYAFELGDDVLTITGGDVDLIEFEKLKLAAEAFVTAMRLDGQSSPSTPQQPRE